MSDTIKVNASLASLDAQAEATPFVFGISKNKRITFPHPSDMSLEAAEALADILNSDGAKKASTVFERWLSAADYAALVAEKLTVRQANALAQLVTEHYQDVFGTPGN